MAQIFYFHFFLMTQKGLANLSENPQRSVKINIWQFLFQLIIVGRLGQVWEVFSPGIFINI